MRRWFKLFMRKRSQRLSQTYARLMKQKLATAYCFFAWNAAGLFAYNTFKVQYPMTDKEKIQPGRYYARLLQGENIEVYQVDGLHITDHYVIDKPSALNPDDESIVESETTEFSNENEVLE